MKLSTAWREFDAWWNRQAYHFVFIFSLFVLTLLVTWWSIFLYQSVIGTYQIKIQSIRQSVTSYSLFLGHSIGPAPGPGVFHRDHRLEIIASPDQPGPDAVELLPRWKGSWLQPRETLVTELNSKLRKKRFMIIGESSLLVLVVLVSGFMIYRMYWLEKRTTQELHELWSRVSHEIKTPITGVKAFLETLQAKHLSPEEMEPLVALALKQVERQQQLTENMLVGQKLKRRGAGINLTDLQPLDFVRQYVEKHPLTLSGKNLRLEESDPAEFAQPVSTDPEALRIIFDNLIENAVKYGGPWVSVSIRLEQWRKGVGIIFEDNGPGFEPGMSEKIFKAYSRLGNELPGDLHGTGMGLYISRRLARTMEGNLTAESEGKGKGARFILSLRQPRKRRKSPGIAENQG
ncbi:MAG: HAMP domain-containing histidine kinase [bacterium]|nr:HAMP domain-containing histidine kinase [bacterium]